MTTSSQHDLTPYGAVVMVLITVLLAGAKLSGLLAIGWGWVLLPALLPLAVVVLLLALALVMEWAVRKL